MMKLGEKLQQLRKKSGLSQEQLAAQITVSRQAVSKWELDETMPDTDNVIQLSRLFGVSCDYLLRDEVEDPSAPQPALAPDLYPPAISEEPRPTNRNLTLPAAVLALALCAVSLVAAFMWQINGHTLRPLLACMAVQALALGLFEFAAFQDKENRRAVHADFYMAACWLVLPVPLILLFQTAVDLMCLTVSTIPLLTFYFVLYPALCAAAMAALVRLRRRQAHNK